VTAVASSATAAPARLAAAVHRHSPLPLHHQIKVAVVQGIEEGWLEPGDRLPRERDLAEALGVSLAPVRQAMLDLTKEGYVDRARGKGTFVRDHKLVEKIQILGSFHTSVAGQGPNLTVTVVGSEVEDAPRDVVDALGLRTARAWRLRRLAVLDAEPLAFLTAWLPTKYAKGVRQRDLGSGSLYEALADVHGVEMTSADNVIEVDRVSLDGADVLGLAPGAPVLRVVGVTRDQDGRPVEYSDVLYRPERFKIAIESSAPRRRRGHGSPDGHRPAGRSTED
jgi:GntR family transcriptional regulator